LAWALHHLAAATGEVDAAIAHRMGLSASDFLALKHLTVASQPLGPVELGRMLGITSGAATGLVDRLQRAGYARREAHPRDRRRQVVTVTARAEQRMLHELRPLAADVDRAAAELTDDERRMVTDVLVRLAALHRRNALGGRQ
jgi:DNA-binding MarR family transcriptional regulator